MKNKKKNIVVRIVFIVLLVLFDQFTKHLAVLYLKGQQAVPIIKDVFELQYLENTSAAFGVDPVSLLHHMFRFDVFVQNPELYLNVRMWFFYIVAFLMILVFIWALFKTSSVKRFVALHITLTLMIAGAIGNLIDRISKQCVVDFFYFKLINFPIFNVADIYVTCAAILLLVLSVFYYRDEDIEIICQTDKKEG
jgi:signal peptidase II